MKFNPYDETQTWPYPFIPEEGGRECLKLMSNISYHNACDSMAEVGDAQRETWKLAAKVIEMRLSFGAIRTLVNEHAGLVSVESVVQAVLGHLYSHMEDDE